MPADSQAPLALNDMNQVRLRLFFRQLMPVLGFGDVPPEWLAPQFKAHLFQRWFLSLASPPSADGNGGPHAFPLKDMFLASTYNRPALARGCEGSPDRPMLMRVDYLRDNVAAQFRREYPDAGPAAGKWILDGLLSIFEPTLLRRDLPPKLRYGEIEWALLDMGIRMAGRNASDYSYRQLVGLASAVDIVGSDGKPGLGGAFAGSAMRMAHAHGAIDLRGAGGDLPVMLEKAVVLFQEEADALRQINSMPSLIAGLPTRGSIVAAELRRRGLDPQASYRLRRREGYGRGLLESLRKTAPGLAFDEPHALAEFVMAGCMPQLYEFGDLSPAALKKLERGLRGLGHAELDAMFEARFDAAFNAFADGMLARFLNEKIGLLDISDQHFWQCGRAAVTVPQARIVARIAPKVNWGAVGAGSKTTVKAGMHAATRGVLAALTLDRGGPAETRHYWITLAPLAAGRFDGDVGALLAGRLNDFFAPEQDERALMMLAPAADIGFAAAADSDPPALPAQQAVARQLLQPQRAKLREKAFQITGPESQLEQMTQFMLDMLPFRACIRSREEGEHYKAALFCMADVVSLLPMVRAGGQVIRNAARLAATQSRPQLRRVAQTLAAGTVEHGIAYAAVHDVLQVGRPMLLTAKEAARFMNPIDPLWVGLGWMRKNGKPMGIALLEQLRKTPLLRNLARDMDREMALPCVFENGFWRAADDAPVMFENGRRQLAIAGGDYALADIGGRRNVLTLGAGDRRYLADPRSGGVMAPVLRPATNLPRRIRLGRACGGRFRRGLEDACPNAIEPARKFGAGYQRIAGEARFDGMQISVRQLKDGRKSYLRAKVDLNDLGFFSYTKVGEQMYGPLNRYFAFEKKIWIAENGKLRPTATACPYPARIEATVRRFGATGPQADGATYLRFEFPLPPIPGDARHFHQSFIAPYGTYAGPKGECMGMLDFPDASYTFKHSWISELRTGDKIVLKRLPDNAPDRRLFEQYRRINLNVRMEPDVFQSGSLYQLREAGPATRERFDAVCRHAEKMLLGAHQALRNPSPTVDLLMETILPQRWSRARKRRFLDQMECNVEDMIAALDIVKRNRYDVIGFGVANRGYTGTGPMQWMLPYARAEALSASMMGEMNDFPLIAQALIHFDIVHFQTARKGVLAMDLVHELSHAGFDSSDTMHEASLVSVYPRNSDADRNVIDIQPLIEAWAESGSDVPMHAASNEVLVKLLSAAIDPAQKGTLDDIMSGGSTFALQPDPPEPACADGCVLQR